jgi:hypothetical protein
MAAENRGELPTVTQAQRALGVSKTKMARLIAEGALHAEPDPLDKRYKLIARAQVDALKARSRRAGGRAER